MLSNLSISINLISTNPLTHAQQVLVEQLVRNDFDNIDPKLYHGMSVPDIAQAMDVAFEQKRLMKSTPLGRALS